MRSLSALRRAALFVGSVVGAGFATGQEVRLFFGTDGVGSLLVASLFMAVCVCLFMEIGARRLMGERLALATDTLVSLSSLALYAAMIAASEEVLTSLTGQSGYSVPLAISVSLLSAKGTRGISLLSLLALPVMIAVILLVGRSAGGTIRGGCHLLPSLSYGGMNLLFSGAWMIREGEGSTRSERIATSLLAGLAIFVMLYYMRRSVSGGGDMPFLDAADRVGRGLLARVTLLLAIVTTMGGCAYLGIERLNARTGDLLLSGGAVTLLGILLSSFGFAPIVRVTYPVVSYLGLAATLAALVSPIILLIKKKTVKISSGKIPSGD